MRMSSVWSPLVWGYLLRSLGQCLRYDCGRLYLTYGTSTSSPSVSLQHSSSTKAFTWLGIFFLETLLTTSDNLQFNITFWSKSEWIKFVPTLKRKYIIFLPLNYCTIAGNIIINQLFPLTLAMRTWMFLHSLFLSYLCLVNILSWNFLTIPRPE